MISVKDKKNCSGCQACYNACPQGCIKMKIDMEGFWYPEADIENCLDCSTCDEVCPIRNNKYGNEDDLQNKIKAYACYNKDEDARMGSSSGGLFSVIAERMIEKGGVVFGASFDKNCAVTHICIEKITDLGKLRGSKYVQSRIGNSYQRVRDLLTQNRQVLFTGTPCQVAGLRAFLGQRDDNLFCIDIICYGVPSPKVWQKYLTYQENLAGSKAEYIYFRSKVDGWKNYNLVILFENNTQYSQPHGNDLFMKAFLNNVCLRPSCYDCTYKTLKRKSDITLADFWGVQDILPEMDDDKGTSLIFINTDKGQKLFEQINECIVYSEVDINQALVYNPAAIKSSPYNPKRNNFLKNLEKLPFDRLVKKYCMDSLVIKVKRKVKSLVLKILKRAGFK